MATIDKEKHDDLPLSEEHKLQRQRNRWKALFLAQLHQPMKASSPSLLTDPSYLAAQAAIDASQARQSAAIATLRTQLVLAEILLV